LKLGVTGALVRHFKDPRFKPAYDALPARVRTQVNKSFALLKQDPKHPSLHFKHQGRFVVGPRRTGLPGSRY
jgi:hypothetical protein